MEMRPLNIVVVKNKDDWIAIDMDFPFEADIVLWDKEGIVRVVGKNTLDNAKSLYETKKKDHRGVTSYGLTCIYWSETYPVAKYFRDLLIPNSPYSS